MASNSELGKIIYVILRKDLLSSLHWPLGALVAQGCHATAAVLWLHKDDDEVKAYMENIDAMRKVVLEIENEPKLRELDKKLSEAKIDHKLWIEQPENVATCIAVKPYPKSVVHPFVKSLKLFKGE